MGLAGIRIVLVEPAGPLNLGSIARVMKNFGLCNLVLVNPQCDRSSDDALKMAVHAKEILDSAIIVDTLPQALQGCVRAIATIGRDYSGEIPLENPRTTLPWLLEEPEKPVALIFGREDRGLSNEEINYAQKLVFIPTSPIYPSLNLATAVSICCYELSQLAEIFITPEIPPTEIAPLDIVEPYYQELESLLLSIGYIYPHTAASRMEKFRHLYNRAHIQTAEVAMLRGILRQIEWALKEAEGRR
ncbi:RNA methyltransferase [Anabaena cylindrica FACHB-243]|uniref:tRNA (cytidine/uridine-2'-O-)-methyltransferase TrmJ n=1 Tax=Anabaena cylindrica (strain ATCC 27899 / PCC 7122) TaxID=272123 RepID=K9ZPI9_ANACC|nr:MULTISPECIES: RNA methyltransferase [Anabaena]AFZ60472.1 RNA methyltransferase, TrmH family, group 1 [Anabaena cylindrica PCC 7122]MBD2416457.1 RNA methyltransferase [Anabaena cylindrica FACHB-243]MBY5284831.1 RNA methyltransferase [Anabaena sp. CCAP 1446/1C]MBY5310385.1 RNA methyltransferase [Anabaena sp. CCAP 1446/1C]MCM2408512.1 RNA methyltransferase [Anabaena sp. CCAP 1446/1C]